MSYVGTNRNRTQNVCLLGSEIRKKNRRRLRRASIAIVGSRQTGKKTLARRFGAMDQGPFEEDAQSRFYYMAYVDLDSRPTDGTGDVYLKSFVVPPPSDLPAEDSPCYFREFFDFSAMIFLCSVIDRATFEDIVDEIYELRWEYLRRRLPHFLIVGNKMDLNRNIFPRPLSFTYGLFTTANSFGVNYEECSAKQNINVEIILEEILLQIIAEQP